MPNKVHTADSKEDLLSMVNKAYKAEIVCMVNKVYKEDPLWQGI